MHTHTQDEERCGGEDEEERFTFACQERRHPQEEEEEEEEAMHNRRYMQMGSTQRHEDDALALPAVLCSTEMSFFSYARAGLMESDSLLKHHYEGVK